MPAPSLLCPSSAELHVDQIAITGDLITITASARRSTAACPACETTATRVQSRYVRTLADLPWQGTRVQLRVTVRRWYCDAAHCPRRIFAERLPETAARYARRTCRAARLLETLGFALGGRAGARLAAALGLASAPGTVLARVRCASLPAHPTPRVLGVDDWAMRRGQRYGTVLVDLERRCVVDLLPDREAATFATWLREHPGVVTISRDRGASYAEGARLGAPEATQVADRFHLVHNLVQALDRACTRQHAALRSAAIAVATAAHEAMTGAPAPEPPVVDDTSFKGAAFERARQERRARRLARYDQVVTLHGAGHPKRQVARLLGLDRRTVALWLAAGCFPERAKTTSRAPRLLDRFRTEVVTYYDAGGDSATELTAQLTALGFRGQRVTVWRALRALRAERPRAGATATPMAAPPTVRVPSASSTAWLLRKPVEQQTTDEQAFLAALLPACPALAEGKRLGDEFVRILREHDAAGFDTWLAAAEESELRSFATGIRRDEAAVRAAITSCWSNGQVEGQVHRIKLVKRSMYGRAAFPLLRARMLHAS